MAYEWPTRTIAEIAAKEPGSIAIGPFGSRMKSDCYVPSGVRVIRGNNLTSGRTFSGDFVFVTPDKAKSLGSSQLSPYDLVFPHRGAIGEIGIVPDDGHDYLMSTSLMKLTCDCAIVCPEFVYYFFKSSAGRYALLANTSQVGTPGIGQPLSSLKSIRIPTPPQSEQREIVGLLSVIDGRIELVRQSTLSLETIARAIFKSWFVDFDPVRAKAEGREPEGMDAATGALFPSTLASTRFGPLPDRWGQTELHKVTEVITRGIAPKYEDEGFRVVNQRCIRDGRVDLELARRHDWSRRVPTAKLLQDHDTLVNSTGVGTLGRVAQIFHTDGQTTVDSHVTIVRPDNAHVNADFLGTLLLLRQSEIEGLASGTTGQTELSRDSLGKLSIILPSSEVMRAYGTIARPLREKVFQNQQTSKTLAELRDTLLPRLISGKVRIPEAEKLVEALV